MTALWAWCQAHPLLAWIGGGVVLSTLWYSVRRGAWPGVETAKLPRWARVVQSLIEGATNLPGALAAQGIGPALPPGAPASRTPTLPPSAPAALALAALVCGGAVACGPRPVATAALALAPGVPAPTGCAPVGATRCAGAVPEACGESGRWWPSPACPGGCVVEDAGARCARADAGVVE